MIVAATSGVESNLELTLPLVVIVVLFGWLWGDIVRALRRRMDDDAVDAEFDEDEVWLDCFPEPPLRLVSDPRPRGVVERRPEDRERARRERDEARQSRHPMEGQERSAT